MPHFRNGYDKHLDLTEDEYYERLWFDLYGDEPEPQPETVEQLPLFGPAATPVIDIEGEPFEDTYLPGIPDYDRFGRPSWEVPE